MPRSRKLHASEQIISARISWCYRLDNTKPIKHNFLPYKIIRFIRSLSLVQIVAPNTCKNNLFAYLIDLRVIHACEWLLRNPTRPSSVLNFKEYLINATVFSELAHHTETKMTIFTIGPLPRPLQGFRLFSGKSARRPRLLTSTKIKLFSRLFCAECRM